MSLVRSPRLHDADLDTLTSRLAELDATLRQRAALIGRVKADLAAFRSRYHQEVGLLHEELDELQQAIADAELGEAANHAESRQGRRHAATAATPGRDPLPRFTSDAVRKLFRDVAKVIHPDLADDEVSRDRRHSLMIEANRAYAMGDEERLRWILDAWENRPEAVDGSGPDAVRERLIRQVAQREEQLAAYDAALAETRESPLWRLKLMVDESASRGTDLVAETVRRLKRDVMVARQRLDAIHWRP